jgi:DNA-directed RNA polymerase specialized sigma24 family protein
MDRADELRLYFARVRPVYQELFGMAHAITGNYDRAEYCLQRTILEGFLRRRRFRSARGFRESLKSDMRRIALAGEMAERELTFDAFAQSVLGGPAADPMRRLIEQEDAVMRRLIMLRHGCELSARQSARAVGMPGKQGETLLARFEKRAKRRLDSAQRARIEGRLQDICREELLSGAAPDAGAVLRTFEAEAAGALKPVGLVPKIAARLLFVAALLLVALFVWLAAAVIRPAALRTDGRKTETLVDQ